jgi:NADH dehydrogenase
MMNDEAGQKARPVTVFGRCGFIGRHVVQALVGAGWRIRIGCRRPELATDLRSVGPSGRIQLAHVDLRHPQTIAAALAGGDAAVNLVGILTESGQQTFAVIMLQGARNVAEAVAKAGITRFVHVSAIGADKNSHSAYARSKAEGEAAVREHVPQAIILRPSIVFGPGDDFFNRFAAMTRLMPVLPLVGASTRFQQVSVDDIAESVVLALDGRAVAGVTYETLGRNTTAVFASAFV